MGAITWSLELLADDSTPIPGRAAQTFRYFSEPTIDGTTVAFVGSDVQSAEGVYRAVGRVLERVADRTTPVPGQSELFSTFGIPVAVGDDVIFTARTPSTNAIYRSAGGVLSLVVDQSEPLPGVSNALGYGYIAASGSSLYAQSTNYAYALGVHRIQPGPIETLAVVGGVAPGGTYGSLSRITTDGPRTGFLTAYAGESRWALMVAEPGNVRIVAEAGTVLPNGQLEEFDRRVLHGQANGRFVFVANPVGLPASVYVWEAGTISLAFEGTQTPSGGGPFDQFYNVALGDDAVVTIGRTGLNLRVGTEQVELFNWSTLLQGRRIAGALLGPAGVSHRALAVKVYFDGDAEGILRVTFDVPTPVSGSGGGGGGGAMDVGTLGGLLILARLALTRRRARLI